MRKRRLNLRQRRIHGRQIDGRIARFLRHTEPAAEVDGRHGRELLGDLHELTGHGAPVVRIEDATAAVRVDADDLGSSFRHKLR